tara:strand:- start:499 stop:2415 length:1917 start_codon:yes stop_codon:yes gene_type:complete
MNKYEFIISAKDRTAQAFSSINKNLKITSAGLARIGGGAAGVVTALAGITINASKNAKELKLLADMAGLTVDEFQSTSYAMRQFNISQEEFADIAKDVQDKLGDFIATGGGEFADFFEQVAPKVGLTAEALKELSGPQVLIAVKNAMDAANVSAKEQVFYLESIANDATKLAPILANNGQRLKELQAEYEQLNIKLNQTEVNQLTEFNNEVVRLQTLLEGMGNRIAVALVDPLSSFNDELSEVKTEAIQRVERVFIGVDRSITAATLTWYEFQDAIGRDIDPLMLTNLQGEIDYLDRQWQRLTDKINGVPIAYSLGSGETDDIFAGLDDPFDLTNAVTNVDIKPAAEGIKSTLLDSLSVADEFSAQLVDMNGMIQLSSDAFWTEYEQRGINAYVTLTEQNQTFWQQWLEAAEQNLQNFDELSGITIESFSRSMGDAFESMALESETFEDAMKGIFESVARTAINSLGQMAAQWLAYQAVQMLVGKSTAVAGASGLALNAQAMSLMAGLNAFTSTAAIPIVGPPAAPAAMGAALSVTQPIATAISSLSASAAVASFDGGGYTPSGARIGGIDNKGGRLAVLHPNEKVTDLTKSTSATSLVINTTTNVHGSGDDEAVIRAIERNPKKIARIINRLSGTPV